MATKSRPPLIAVFDSGIGGMTILASLLKKIPTAKYIYYGDTANAPYGPRSAEEIFSLSVAAIEKLMTRRPDVIVIACNTVTSTSISKLREKFPTVQFVGVEPAVKPAVIVTERKKVIVAATAATLKSDSYRQLKTAWAAGIEVIDLAKPNWVAMIEADELNAATLAADAQMIAASGADTLVLACTHFPFLKPKLQELLPGVMIIDSAEPVASRVQRLLELSDEPNVIDADIQWQFSDQPQPDAARLARLWTIAQHIG